MTTPETTLTCVELVSSLEAASEARRKVRDVLAGADPELVDQATLLVDELVASALVNAGAPVQLVLERHPAKLVVEVIDAAPSGADRDALRLPPAAQVILDACAGDWGSTESSVWFSLPTGQAVGPAPS